MRSVLIFLLVFFKVCGIGFSQSNTSVQFNDLKGGLKRHLLVTENDFVQIYFDSVGEVKTLGSFKTRKVKKVDYKGRKCLFIMQKYQSARGKNFDTAILEAETLRPIEYHSNIGSSNYKEHAYFEEGKINLRINYIDSIVEKVFEFPENTFLFTSEREVIGALPLELGYVAHFRLVNTGVRHQIMEAFIKVIGEETLQLDHKAVKVYKVGISYNKLPEGDSYPTILSVTRKGHMVIQSYTSRIGFVERMLL